jgi:hypothetical protein
MISLILLASLSGVQLPPAKFDHPPRQKMHVLEGTHSEIQRTCRVASKYRGEREILACAIPSKKFCIIIWPKGKPRSGDLWRHERAHCNGWKH